MIVFRLSKTKYAHDLSGLGAKISGGRWNSVGVPMLYTSESRALCATEIAVHTPVGILPLNYSLIEIEIPDEKIDAVDILQLPNFWNSFPYNEDLQSIGDEFVENDKFLALKVPSAVISGDYNYLLNPNHTDFQSVKIINIVPFGFDKRLFKML